MNLDELKALIGTPKRQGKCIVEECRISPTSDKTCFKIMFPDGTTNEAQTKQSAETKCKTWFKKDAANKVGVGMIEWRLL